MALSKDHLNPIIEWGGATYIPSDSEYGLEPVVVIDSTPLVQHEYEGWEQIKWLALVRASGKPVQVVCNCEGLFDVPVLNLVETIQDSNYIEGQLALDVE